MRFVPVDKITTLSNGLLQVFPIDGIGSEGALACNLKNGKLLWGSDHILDVPGPTDYAGKC